MLSYQQVKAMQEQRYGAYMAEPGSRQVRKVNRPVDRFFGAIRKRNEERFRPVSPAY